MLLKHPHSGLKVMLAAGLLSLVACQSPTLPQTGSASASNQSRGISLNNQLGYTEFSPDGRWLLWTHSTYFHNGGPPTELGWYLYDSQSGKQRELWLPGSSGGFKAQWAGNGQLITQTALNSGQTTYIRQIDPATDTSKILWQGQLAASSPNFYADKGQVAWISEPYLYLLKLSESQPRRLPLPESEAFVRGITIVAVTDESVLLQVQKPLEHSGASGFKTLLSPPPPSL